MGAADAGAGRVAAAFRARGRVVLDDVVLPVREPHRAIGANLGEDRGHPLVGAGNQVEGVVRRVARAVAPDREERDDLHRGLAHHRLALQARGQLGGVDEGAAGCGGVAAEDVDLAEVRRDGPGAVLGVDAPGGLGPHPARHDRRRDAAEEEGRVVGGPAELVPGLVDRVAPGVVRELVQELERRAVGAEPEGALRELPLLAADHAPEAGIPHAAVEPVIEAVVQVVRLRVGVAHAPAGHHLPALVRAVVAVGVPQEEEPGWLRHHDAAIGEDEAGGDVQVLREDREPVRPAVAVGVLTDPDAVVAAAVRAHVVGIVLGLGDPEAAALVPGEEDRLGDVRLGGEQFHAQVRGDLDALPAALRRQGQLERHRLRALLVIGDGRPRFPLLRLPRRHEPPPLRHPLAPRHGYDPLPGPGGEAGRVLRPEARGFQPAGRRDAREGGETFNGGVEDHRVEASDEVGRRLGRRGEVVEPDGFAAQFPH